MGNRYNPNTGRKEMGTGFHDGINLDVMSRAVHETVCRIRGADGPGACHLYAMAGWWLLQTAKPDADWQIQAGDWRICPDPSDPDDWFGVVADDNGFLRGEFHAWIANPSGILADFSARHYKALCGSLINVSDRPRARWNRPEPPDFLIYDVRAMPDYVRFKTRQDTSQELSDKTHAEADHPQGLKAVCRLADQIYREMSARE